MLTIVKLVFGSVSFLVFTILISNKNLIGIIFFDIAYYFITSFFYNKMHTILECQQNSIILSSDGRLTKKDFNIKPTLLLWSLPAVSLICTGIATYFYLQTKQAFFGILMILFSALYVILVGVSQLYHFKIVLQKYNENI